jgi:hypothetical protein
MAANVVVQAGGSVWAVARRYRCNACGNLTRFTVTTRTRTRAFHHFTVGGELTVEDEEVLSEVIEDVHCRWCSPGGAVEELRESEV